MGAAPGLAGLVSAFRLAAAAVLVALAILVALLAADVRSWRAALSGGDALYAAAPERAAWVPPTRLGGLAADVLDVKGDLALRRALQAYDRTAGLHLRLDNALDVQAARAGAADALERAARDSNGQRAAQARTLLGILAFRAFAKAGGETQVNAAAADFTDAVRADASSEEAKFDLELLLRATAAHGVRKGSQGGPGAGRTGRRGAGGGIPGSGY